jgi:MFS family permease
MEPGKAAVLAAGFVLVTGLGMVVTGMITDRVSRVVRARKWSTAIVYCALSFTLLGIGFLLPPGPLQLVLIAAGMFVCAGACGPAGAMVANLTPAPIHGSAFATLTLANNLLGLAPAAILMGMLADRIGLLGALQIVPFAPLVAAIVFVIGKANYGKDLARLEAGRDAAPRPARGEPNGYALSGEAA